MKQNLLIVAALMMFTACSYKRIGTLTMVSTRNVNTSKVAHELMRDVEGKSKSTDDDKLQSAIDAAVRMHPQGEYLMNVTVLVSDGNIIKVKGDVWGY
jgi:hypothetical protein